MTTPRENNLGLKSALKNIATTINVSWHELHNVQRRLVKDGVIRTRPGRGPGSGAAATPENIAAILVSFFAEEPASRLVCSRDYVQRRWRPS